MFFASLSDFARLRCPIYINGRDPSAGRVFARQASPQHRPVCFLALLKNAGFAPAHFFGADKFRKSQVPSRLRIATENATVNTFRPVERTYSTKIPRFRRPETATFRFIAHQACILYHKLPQIATLIYRCFRRNLTFKKRPKYTNCTKTRFQRLQKEIGGIFWALHPLFFLFFEQKKHKYF